MKPATRLARICLALPEATVVEQWGGPTYRVRNTIFAKLLFTVPSAFARSPAELLLPEEVVARDATP